MANELCLCGGQGNTGQSNCQTLLATSAGLIFVDYYSSAGVVNTIDPSVAIDASFIEGKLNNADLALRWRPVMGLKAVTDERADPLTESIDGVDVIVEDGVRTFVADLINHGPEYLGQLNQLKCRSLGMFIISNDEGHIQGAKTSAGLLAPIKIDMSTFFARLVKASIAGTTVQRVRLQFAVDKTENDANLREIDEDNVTVDLLRINGLFDMVGETATGISTTGFTMKIHTINGPLGVENPVTGLTDSDIEAYNETSAATVALLTVTESPEGTYAVTFAAQTPGHVLRLQKKAALKGYDDTILKTTKVTIV